MNYLDCSIKEIHEALVSKKTTVFELTKEAISRAKKDTNNAFEYICEKEALSFAKELDQNGIEEDNLLYGIPYVAKDNFSTKDIPTCGSSKILEGYIPSFDATVIEYLKNNKAILIGKTTLDELAMGGTGTTGHLGKTFNPFDKKHERMIGGSSGGSAAACAASIVPFSLGSDTGDSVRKPASYSALCGFKPTWGLVSRYGLFPFVPSLDHVAFFTRSVEDCAIVLDAIDKKDDKDLTNSILPMPVFAAILNKEIKGKKIAVIKEIFDAIDNEKFRENFLKSIYYLKSKGAIVDFVSFDKSLLETVYPAYFIITCSEATSNNANYDGIKFGKHTKAETYEEIIKAVRTTGFNSWIKRRFVIGSYSLMKENQQDLFLKAKRVRRVIVDKFNKIFEEYDAVYNLCSSSIAPKFSDKNDSLSEKFLIAENHLAIANFGGFPSLTIPLGFDENMPFGVNIISKAFNDQMPLNIGYALEDFTNLKGISALNYKKE